MGKEQEFRKLEVTSRRGSASGEVRGGISRCDGLGEHELLAI